MMRDVKARAPGFLSTWHRAERRMINEGRNDVRMMTKIECNVENLTGNVHW